MSDLTAGKAAGDARQGGGGPVNGGAPPPVLMGALAAAMLIGIILFATLGRFGGGDEDSQVAPVRDAQADPDTPTAPPDRVLLAVTMVGGGDGVIQIQPGDIACTKSCEHEFDTGTRVTVTADAKSGSTFSGWADACDGTGSCSLRMDAGRALDATFDLKPTASADPLCEDLDAAQDPACVDGGLDGTVPGDEDLDAPLGPAAGDCADSKDNDGDGLTDAAQDPNCSTGTSEAGSGASTGATAPPPSAAPKECTDKRDNDGDGLIDTAQDPGCPGGGTEA